MGYLQDIDQWLEELLQDFVEGKTFPDLKRAIREKILESYRNGQQAGGQPPAPRAPAKGRGEKKRAGKPQRFAGNWECVKCGRGISSLSFEPKGKSTAKLLCLDCYNAGRGGG